MVSQDSLQAIIGLAVIDREFCAGLLSSPLKAVEKLGLTEHERAVIGSIRAQSLEEFAARLELQLAKLPVTRSAERAAPLWTNDLHRRAG